MKEQPELTIETVPIDHLVPYENNANIHSDYQIDQIVASIEEFGFTNPVLVWENDRGEGEIIAGHGRVLAAKKLGLRELPVIYLNALSDEQRRALTHIDNQLTRNSIFDVEILEAEIEQLDFDWKAMGFEDFIDPGDGESNPSVEEVGIPETIVRRAKRGDIWQLGKHRVMCGDSTDASDVDQLMGGSRADICFTSPPYNMAEEKRFDSANINKAMGCGNAYGEYSDNLTFEEYGSFLTDAISNALDHSDDVMFNVGILKGSKVGLLTALFNHRDKLSEIIVWNKSQSMPSGLPDHKGLVSHRCELIFCFNDRGIRTFSHPQRSIGSQINRIDTNNASQNEYAEIHSATFPIELASAVISDYSENSVLDLFGGTGTTLMAAEQLNRKCYMMELDPHYVDVIIQRWEDFTGNKAVKIV